MLCIEPFQTLRARKSYLSLYVTLLHSSGDMEPLPKGQVKILLKYYSMTSKAKSPESHTKCMKRDNPLRRAEVRWITRTWVTHEVGALVRYIPQGKLGTCFPCQSYLRSA